MLGLFYDIKTVKCPKKLFLRCKKFDFRTALVMIVPVLRIRIRWIRKILASWLRIHKNMRVHGSGSKG